MKLFLIFSFCIFILLASPGCATPRGESTQPIVLNVFAAASLTESFTDIGEAFEDKNPGIHILFNFAGSQQLAQQIIEGAPADVFASANVSQMNKAVQSGQIAPDSPQTFVTNRLVVIFPAGNPARLNALQDLAQPGLRIVLAAGEVPVGRYSDQFLERASKDPAFVDSFREDVRANVVSFEDNVRIVLTKVALGEADAGIVYSSDVTGESASRLGLLPIPDALNVFADYPIALVNDSPNANIAALFISFVLSPDGQQILKKYGFIPVLDLE